MRDLKKDLKICQKATKGPWSIFGGDDDGPNYIWSEPDADVVADELIEEDAQFITESREGWPYALELLRQVAWSIQNNKADNGAVFLGDELKERIKTIL